MSILLFNKIIKKILRNFIKILPTNYHFPSEKMLNSETAKEMRAKRTEKDENRKKKRSNKRLVF